MPKYRVIRDQNSEGASTGALMVVHYFPVGTIVEEVSPNGVYRTVEPSLDLLTRGSGLAIYDQVLSPADVATDLELIPESVH